VVSVYREDGTLAALYSDDGVTAQANPMRTDANGEFSFYAADGVYSITLAKNGHTARTISGVALLDGARVQAPVDDYPALREYAGGATSVFVLAPGIAGTFVRDATVTVDNGGTEIVGVHGWKRVFDPGFYEAVWFGVKADGATEDYPAAQACITAAPIGSTIELPAGVLVIGTAFSGIKHGHRFVGAGVPQNNLPSPFLPTVGQSTVIKFTGASGWLFPMDRIHFASVENMGITAVSTNGGVLLFDGSEYCAGRNLLIRSVNLGTAVKFTDTVSGCYFNVLEDVQIKSSMQKALHIATGLNGFVNNNIVRNVEISGGGVGTGVQIECGNTNLFDMVSIEPAAVTCHLRVTGGSSTFRAARIEGTEGAEGRIRITGGSVQFTENGPVNASNGVRDALANASLARVESASNVVPDPEFATGTTLPLGFTLATGTLSTQEFVTSDRPAFAYFGRSFHAVSSAALVDVRLLDATKVTTLRGRTVAIRGWCKAVSGSAAMVIRAFSPTLGNVSSTFTTFTIGEWIFMHGGIQVPADATNLQCILRINGSGSEAYFFLPYMGENNAYHSDRKVLSAGGDIVPGVLEFQQGFKFNGSTWASGTAAPVSGTWARGDIVWNSAPSAAGSPGWVCTLAGTPGTWKAMANIAA
jgi:hypothetical protein